MFDLNEDGLKHHQLPNGMRVYLRDEPASTILHVGMFIRHGAHDEDMRTSGIAHYIEHVLFTPRYFSSPTAALYSALERQGASYEAFTSKEYTRASLKCLPRSLASGVEFLSLIAQTRRIEPGAVDGERAIILHEHAMNFSSSTALERQVLDNAMWGDRSIGLFLLGRKENIQRFTREEIEARIRTYFTPERALLVAIGPFDAVAAAEEIERRFSGAWGGGEIVPDPIAIPAAKVIPMPTQSKRVSLQLGYTAVPLSSPDRYAVELLADILGGGHRSRLFRELREVKKLVYHVQALPVCYELGGHIAIAINGDRDEIKECYETIRLVLESLQTSGATLEELERAKAERTMKLLDIMDTNKEYIHLVGRRGLLKDPVGITSEIEKIKNVDLDKISELARRIFVDEGLGAVGFGLEESEMSALFE